MTPAANGSDSSTYGLPSRLVVDARAETLGDRDHLVRGAARALAHQQGDPLAGVEHVGRRAEVLVARADPRRPPARRRSP